MRKIKLEVSPDRTQLIAGALLVLGFGAVGGLLLSGNSSTDLILVAKKDLPSGIKLSIQDFASVEVNGAATLQTVSVFPSDGVLVHPLKSGEILQAADIDEATDSSAVIAVALNKSDFPRGVMVGQRLEIWRAGEGVSPEVITAAEVVEFEDSEYGDTVALSIRVDRSQIEFIFGAGTDLKVVIPN